MFSIINWGKGMGLNYKTRTFFITARIYSNHRGLFHWFGEHLEVSLYNRKIWRRVLCYFLLNFFSHIRPTDCGNGICGGPGKSAQRSGTSILYYLVPGVMGGGGIISIKKRLLVKACPIRALQESTSAIFYRLLYL